MRTKTFIKYANINKKKLTKFKICLKGYKNKLDIQI